ncbi:MAG: T9SS type A sorting domain-containing protein, partial [Candidatus Hodarchaeota archaeon]
MRFISLFSIIVFTCFPKLILYGQDNARINKDLTENIAYSANQNYENELLASSDSLKIKIDLLLNNSLNLFNFLRNEKGVYADAARFHPPQFHPASIATIGMGLISLCIANEINIIDNAETLVLKTLETMSGKYPDYLPARNPNNGFFRHWISVNTGEREWNSEYSSIDTGILIAGALFCKNYFVDNQQIGILADSLYLSVDWNSSIGNPDSGEIFMTFDDNGKGLAVTRPFNEYMIVAWLAKNDSRNNMSATKLWERFYSNPDSLLKTSFYDYELLTDSADHFLSNFVVQFPYYLCHYFTVNENYLFYMKNAMMADKKYWQSTLSDSTQKHIWGTGAGASITGTGYNADNFENNPGKICSPHIIAGFIPVNLDGIKDLVSIYNDSLCLYNLPDSLNTELIWRFSIDSPLWKANDIQGVDYSTMIFGLASHPLILGTEFFREYNNFNFPKKTTNINHLFNKKKNLKLNLNYPNPFNNTTNISFKINEKGDVDLSIININGQLIKKIISKTHEAGEYNYVW